MATSTVRGSTEIYAMSQSDTLTVNLQSANGIPLVQFISGGFPVPDWTVDSNRPIIYPHITSTLISGVVSAITNPKWFYDGVRIETGNANFLMTTTEVGSVQVPALKIMANIMADATSNKTIRGEFDVTSGGITTGVKAVIDVRREVETTSSYHGMISASNAGTIDETRTSTTLTTRLYKGSTEITGSGYTVEWWKLVANDVDGTPDGQTDTTKRGKSATFAANEIDIQEVIVAKFFVGANQVATAFMPLYDLSDPFLMSFSTVPFRVPIGGSATTTANVVRRSAPTVPLTSMFSVFSFSLMNGTTQVRAKPPGTNTFVTNHSDFAGGEKLTLIISTTSNS